MGVAQLGEERKERNMECKWCGRETIEIAGDTWDTVCRECRDEEHEQATWVAAMLAEADREEAN
jgi:tRNA(Ile2) C34 agmatinyltransferase TiaS